MLPTINITKGTLRNVQERGGKFGSTGIPQKFKRIKMWSPIFPTS